MPGHIFLNYISGSDTLNFISSFNKHFLSAYLSNVKSQENQFPALSHNKGDECLKLPNVVTAFIEIYRWCFELWTITDWHKLASIMKNNMAEYVKCYYI